MSGLVVTTEAHLVVFAARTHSNNTADIVPTTPHTTHFLRVNIYKELQGTSIHVKSE